METSDFVVRPIIAVCLVVLTACSGSSKGASQANQSSFSSASSASSANSPQVQTRPDYPNAESVLMPIDDQRLLEQVAAGAYQIAQGIQQALTLSDRVITGEPFSAPEILQMDDLQLAFHGYGQNRAAGFEVSSADSKTRASWSFDANLEGQQIIGAQRLHTNQGEQLVILSKANVWTTATGGVIVAKQSAPNPNDSAGGLRITWVDLSEPSAPVTLISHSLTGRGLAARWYGDELYLVSMFYPWTPSLLDPTYHLADDFDSVFETTWRRWAEDGRAIMGGSYPRLGCLSDVSEAAVLLQFTRVDLHTASIERELCVNASVTRVAVSLDGDAFELDSGTGARHIISTANELEYIGTIE